jgi:hypothetical protein
MEWGKRGFRRQGSETAGTGTEIPPCENDLAKADLWCGNSEPVPGFARGDVEVFRRGVVDR